MDTHIQLFRDRYLDPSRPIAVYRNLHARTPDERWSILQGAHVVAHAAAIMLRDVRFVVSNKGFARMRRLGKKIVCATVRGYLAQFDAPSHLLDVRFDHVHGAFVLGSTFQTVDSASMALLDHRGCAVVADHAHLSIAKQVLVERL